PSPCATSIASTPAASNAATIWPRSVGFNRWRMACIPSRSVTSWMKTLVLMQVLPPEWRSSDPQGARRYAWPPKSLCPGFRRTRADNRLRLQFQEILRLDVLPNYLRPVYELADRLRPG